MKCFAMFFFVPAVFRRDVGFQTITKCLQDFYDNRKISNKTQVLYIHLPYIF